MISQDRGGISNPWDPLEKIQMSMGEPIKLSTTFLVSFTQSFNSAKNCLKQLLHWDGKSMGRKFELGGNPFLWKNVFDFWGKKTPKMHAHLVIHPCFPFFLTILLHMVFLHAAEASCVFILHVWSHFPHFCMPRNSFLYC